MNPYVIITQKNPVGGSVRCLLGEGIQTVKADGGWTTIKRPKWVGFTNWDGIDPIETTIPLVLDGFDVDRPVGMQYLALWLMFRPATTPRDHPPIVTFDGPLQFTHLDWVIQSINMTDQILRPDDGALMRATFAITLLQYVPANVVITDRRATPAAAAKERQQSTATTAPTSGRTYTVKSGDTLSRIAATQLGNAGRYREIADLNGIRDPNNISVGQVLRLPSGSASASSPAATVSSPRVRRV